MRSFVPMTVFAAVVLTVLLAGAACGNCGVTAGISVRPKIKVAGSSVVLGAIASIQGDLDFISKAENIVIGRAPYPRKQRVFNRAQIITRLKQHDIDPRDIQFNCPSEVQVIADYIQLEKDDLEKIFSGHIYKHMPWKRSDVCIKSFIGRPVCLPSGRLTYAVFTREHEKFHGRVNADITFKIDGRPVDKVSVSGNVCVLGPVVVARRMIERHAILSADDVVIEQRDITYQSQKAAKAVGDVVGKRARGRVLPGTILKTSVLEEVPVVKKGDIVTLVLETKTFAITTPGEVLEGGSVGDRIRVCNIASKNRVYGIIRNSNEVEVRY